MNYPVMNLPEQESYFFGNLLDFLENKFPIKVDKIRSWHGDISANLVCYTLSLDEEFEITVKPELCSGIIKDIISSHLRQEETYNDKNELKSNVISLETFGRIKNEIPSLLNNLQLTIEGFLGSFILSNFSDDNDWIFEASLLYSTLLGIDSLSELNSSKMVTTYVREFLIFLLLCSPKDQAFIVRSEVGVRTEDDFSVIYIEVKDELYELIDGIDIVKGSEILEILLEARELMLGDSRRCSYIEKLDTRMDMVVCSYLSVS